MTPGMNANAQTPRSMAGTAATARFVGANPGDA